MRWRYLAIVWIGSLGCHRVYPTDAVADAGDADANLGPDELPCDVRAVLEDACMLCHSSPPTSNAPEELATRYDFFAPSSVPGETIAQRTLVRLADAMLPMPPLSEPPASVTEIATLEAWLDAGAPAGTCGQIPQRFMLPTCASGVIWDQGETGADLMHPGRDCVSCHTAEAPQYAYFFAGTVYSALHEADSCESPPPPDGQIEILDESGAVTMTFVADANGNFTSSTIAAGVPVPYTARLLANGLARSMVGEQTSGDCNSCHTEQGGTTTVGSALAPGRLLWPQPRTL